MKELKILHITSWYPNNGNSKEAPWIKKQIKSLDPYAKNEVVHLRVIGGRRLKTLKSNEFGAEHIMWCVPLSSWFLIEILSTLLLTRVLISKHVNGNYDLINFHIAYPNLIYWHWIKKWITIPILITEHWSAYRLNFGTNKELLRVKKIFNQSIPVAAVSNSLIDDIRKFSRANFPSFVVPNVVDDCVFFRRRGVKRIPGRLFMVSQWKSPKRPLIVIEAFKEVVKDYPQSSLIIAGYGPQWEEIKIASNGIEQIELLSKLDAEEISIEMNKASLYVHSSDYETFSVVCAEALNCGCPVVASRVGGIPEFVNENNGVLVNENTKESFVSAFESALRRDIQFSGATGFSPKEVGEKYLNVVSQIIQKHESTR